MRFVTTEASLVRRVAVELLEAADVRPKLASVVADVQLEADLRGVYSHGLRAIPTYLGRIERGIINPRPNIHVEETSRAAVAVDGDSGPGQAVAHRAMSECIARARVIGFGLATARNSNHLGAVGYYATMAVEHGLIGFATTNGNVMLPPPGTLTPVVGNNPVAWAVPAGDEPPLCIDIATSVKAGGWVDLAAAEGDPIPPGWTVDGEGLPTEDPNAAAAGGLALPLGAPAAPHKGFALALVFEALAGVLAGARFGRQHAVEVEQGEMPWDEGHFFMAFDPAMLMPRAEFKRRMDAFIQDIRSVPAGPDGQTARVPGHGAIARKQRALAEGLRLPDSVYAQLRRLAEERSTPTRLPRLTPTS